MATKPDQVQPPKPFTRLVQFPLVHDQSHCFPQTTHLFWSEYGLQNQLRLGFILDNTETGTLQYHHSSANNNLVLEQPFFVSDQADLDHLYQQIVEINFLEWVRQRKPNSKWVVDMVTNATWFVWKLQHHPRYIVDNYGLDALENDNTGKPYQDNLCFFRCLALHNGCHTKNLEQDTKYYYQTYREVSLAKKKFHGVKLPELDE